MIPADTPSSTGSTRAIPPAAFALCAAGAMTLALLAHHPVAPHRDGGLQFADLVRLGDAAAHVHTAIIALVGVLLYGVIALALQLGIRRPAVAFGLAAYGFGCGAMIGAMLLDGFVTAQLAGWLLTHAQPVDADGTPASLALVAIGIQVLTRAGFIGMAAGVVCLSWARVRHTRMLAALSLPGALLPLLAVLMGVRMAPHSLIAMTGLQALWYAGAAWTLWRGHGR